MTEDANNRGLVGSVVAWFAHPFNSQGSALNWILFLGLISIAVWWWNHVLLQIRGEV